MILHDILVFSCTIFLKKYMSKKGNWDFLQLVHEKHLYSYLIGWLGSQAGSWGPRKYPSQIPSQLPRKSHIYLTHLLSNNSLIFYLIDSNSKLGYKVCGLPGACFEISEKKMRGTKLTIARSGESNKCSILYKRQVTHFPLDRVGHMKQWYGVWYGETCEPRQ